MAESRSELQRAENEILRRVALLDAGAIDGMRDAVGLAAGQGLGENPVGDSILQWRHAGAPPRLWTRSNALLVTRALLALVRYPQQSATMYAQFAGVSRPAALSPGFYRALFPHMPVGILYQGFSGYHLGVVGTVVNALTVYQINSLWAMLSSVIMHYCVFAMLYGGFRQAVVTRILDVGALNGGPRVPIAQLVRPAFEWMRDLALRRYPRGSVLCVYVRDIFGNLLQGGLSIFLSRLLTSPKSVSMYLSIAKISFASRRLAASLLHRIGLPPLIAQTPRYLGSNFRPPASRTLPSLSARRAARLRAAAGAITDTEDESPSLEMLPPSTAVPMSSDEASSDADVVFTSIENQLALTVDDDSASLSSSVARRRRSQNMTSSKKAAEQGEYLIYTQAVTSLVSSIVVRALFYPLDAAIIRLMADQAGLTCFGYTGLFNCLSHIRHTPGHGLSSLYAGFSAALASDLALGWLTAE
ncbi:hypothetical protein EV174_004307, partial [Coemansia sp. RSA 2320]